MVFAANIWRSGVVGNRQFESCLLELLNVVVTLFSLSGGIKGWLCRSVGGWGFRHYAPLEPHLMPLQIKKI